MRSICWAGKSTPVSVMDAIGSTVRLMLRAFRRAEFASAAAAAASATDSIRFARLKRRQRTPFAKTESASFGWRAPLDTFSSARARRHFCSAALSGTAALRCCLSAAVASARIAATPSISCAVNCDPPVAASTACDSPAAPGFVVSSGFP